MKGGDNMFDRDLVLTNKTFYNAEEAIKFGGELLYEKGYVKKEYADSVWERERIYPTGLPTDPIYVAIPHTDVTYVKKSTCCIIHLKESVEFHQMGDEKTVLPVKLIIMLAIDSVDAHLEILSKIMNLLSGEDALEKIYNSVSSDEILKIIFE